MTDLESAISILRSALERSSLQVRVGATDLAELIDLRALLPVSDVLLEWYARAAPLEFEIPWAVEWLILFAPTELIDGQVGYRWTGEVGGDEDEEWDPKWLVIGECSADPIIADTGSADTPVLMAAHGTGSWKPLLIAPSLPDYLVLLSCWVDTQNEFAGHIRDPDGEIRLQFVETLRMRLNNVIPDCCIANLLSTIQPNDSL